MGQHVLVADDDEHILFQVVQILKQRGYTVETAHDGKDAIAKAIANPPDLLITDVMMPKLDGWSLVRELRMHPRHAEMPVIFLTALTSEDEKIRAFRLGADDYVNKPFRLDDLAKRVARALEGKRPADTKPAAASSGLRGDLAQVGLSTLLVLVEMERKTGVLMLTAAGGQAAAQIMIRDGKILRADMQKGGAAVDAQCIYQLLRWKAGEFDFAAKPIDVADRIQASTTHLLMEGARLMDEDSAPVRMPRGTEAKPPVAAPPAALGDDAIDEWEEGDQRTPLVVAAKLADLVRRTARATLPPLDARLPAEPAPTAESLRAEIAKAEAAKAEAAKADAAKADAAKAEAAKAEAAKAEAAKAEAAKIEAARAAAGQAAAEKAARDRAAADQAERERAAATKAAAAAKARPEPPPDPDRAVAERASKRATTAQVRRGPGAWWLVAAVVLAAAGTAIPYVVSAPAQKRDAAPMVQADADRLAAAIENATTAAKLRAKNLATTPLLRAGIETDSATLQDLAKNESLFVPVNGEVIEVFQLHEGAPTSVLRTPSTAPQLHPTLDDSTHLTTDGRALTVTASAPIAKQTSGVGGVLAVATPCDLAPAIRDLTAHANTATLTGLDKPVVLLAGAASGDTFTVAIGKGTPLSLAATVSAAPSGDAPGWIDPARFIAWGFGGVLILAYALSLVARRRT